MSLYKLHHNQKPRDFTWPGFVDALASLLMVLVFVLMVFVLIQANLAYRLSGKDESLLKIQNELSMLGELLSLEREASADLSTDLLRTKSQLDLISSENKKLDEQLSNLTKNLSLKSNEIEKLKSSISKNKVFFENTINENKRIIQQKNNEMAEMNLSIDKLINSLSESNQIIYQKEIEIKESKKRVLNLKELVETTNSQKLTLNNNLSVIQEKLSKEEKLNLKKSNEINKLRNSIISLKSELTRLRILLEEKQKQSDKDKIAIENLGEALNTALANKVQELQNFKSEFFGRVRKILSNRNAISIVGDRFVFQSEVLFEPGKVEINQDGKLQLSEIATIILEIIEEIPSEIPWVLQIDGHTDSIPIRGYFVDNWQLSTERALSVLRLFISKGIPPERLSATGYGEFQPLDKGKSEENLKRNRRIELTITQRVNQEKE